MNTETAIHNKTDDTLLKTIIRGLLVKSFEVLNVPRVK